MTDPSETSGDPSWLLPLLLCGEQAAAGDGPHPLDRVRMQKAVFLVTQQGLEHWRHYEYQPYNWGPYSQELADDLQQFQLRRIVILSFAGGARYGRYVATSAGQELINDHWHRLPVRTTSYLRDVRTWVTSKDFNTLLREVYGSYPGFATESLWKPR